MIRIYIANHLKQSYSWVDTKSIIPCTLSIYGTSTIFSLVQNPTI